MIGKTEAYSLPHPLLHHRRLKLISSSMIEITQMSSFQTAITRHSFMIEIAVADELALSPDDIAARLVDSLAPEDVTCPLFGELKMANGHPALLALSIMHVGSKASSMEFAMNPDQTGA
jgi:hypothetical protein